MNQNTSRTRIVLLSALIGAFGGGLVFVLVTRAIPRLVSQITSGFMDAVTKRMREYGVNPTVM